MSNLKKIADWLSVAKEGIESPTLPNKDTQLLVLKLLLEEVTELAESGGVEILDGFQELLVNSKNEVENKTTFGYHKLKEGLNYYLDSLIDIEFILHNGTFFAGLTKVYSEAFDNVLVSNESKYDTTLQDAEATKAKYISLGINTSYKAKCVGNKVFYITYREDGKILKSAKWVESDNDYLLG